MGMFTYVKPAKEILPDEYKKYAHLEWQTKDVVDCEMETLEVTPEGELFYVWWSRKLVESDKSFFGFFMEPVEEHRDKQDYHGDMVFYTSLGDPNKSDWQFIELTARFTNGRLERIWSNNAD